MSIWIFFKMSEALQKMAGSQLRHILGAMTTNRFTGLLTGMFVTASVQSSTATTVMTVSFVNAGLLTLAQAISVIMGANIGTTFTAWIMTLGFSFNMANIVFPVFFIALLLIYRKKHRYIGDFLFGVAFMFFAISTLGATGKEMDLSHNQMVIRQRQLFHNILVPAHWHGADFLYAVVGGSYGHHHGAVFERRAAYLYGYRACAG